MKTTEQLADEVVASFGGDEDALYADTETWLETFRRLVIEDFIAGLEPVTIVKRGVNCYSLLDNTGLRGYDDLPDGTPLYSLEGVKK